MSYANLPLPGYLVTNRCRTCPHSGLRRQPFPFFCNGKVSLVEHPYCAKHGMSINPGTICPDLARCMELTYQEVHVP